MGEGDRKPAILVLEDGTTCRGTSFGAEGEVLGEVVFNTSMIGYQEIITDPSYAGQIVTMTYPLIGNYGVNQEDVESRRVFVEGFIVKELSAISSNWRSRGDLGDYLASYQVPGLEGIDTRALTKHIRSFGAMKGGISTEDLDPGSFLERVKASPGLVGRDLVCTVTEKEAYEWDAQDEERFRVVAFDFGIKQNILRILASLGCRVTVVPASTPAKEVLGLDPQGVFLSNGPGDPQGVPYAIETVRELIGKKPIFGICLGHQILSLALGGDTYKLKFGHRGGNQPVMNLDTEKVEITAQNHGFAVREDSLGSCSWGEVEITHLNLNDRTVEGIRCWESKVFSVQYHPEASPGPHDSRYLFQEFLELMERG